MKKLLLKKLRSELKKAKNDAKNKGGKVVSSKIIIDTKELKNDFANPLSDISNITLEITINHPRGSESLVNSCPAPDCVEEAGICICTRFIPLSN